MERGLTLTLIIFSIFLPLISAANVNIAVQVEALGPGPILILVNPQNISYSSNENILLNFTSIGQDYLLYNLDNENNVTINSSILFNTTYAQHTLYLFAINSSGETERNVTFIVSQQASSSGSTGTGGSSGGGGGGGGAICQPIWSCTEWSNALQQCGTRTCSNTNNCNTQNNKPIEMLNCPIEGVAPQKGYCGDNTCSQDEGTAICKADCSKLDDFRINNEVIFWTVTTVVSSGIIISLIIALKESLKMRGIKNLSNI